MANIYIPRTETFRGTDATGSDGGSSRTISLGNSSPQSSGMKVVVDNASLLQNTDYTLSSNVITFTNALWDTSYIEVTYFIISATESVSSAYATTLQVNEFLQWDLSVPNYPTTTTLETVDSSGTLASGSKIYLDQANVIDNTYTLSYGASADSVTALTETTDYTIDLAKSQITITSTGATTIGSNSVFAEYKYTNFVKDGIISDLIDRATKEIEEETEQTFGGVTLVTREEHTGRGKFSRIYRPRKNLIHVAKITLSTTITSSDTSLTVSDTSDLEAGDYLTIGTEVLSISSVDSSTTLTVSRGALGSTAAAHSSDDWIINLVVEKSNTPVGTLPSFSFLEFRKDFDVDSDTGAVQLLHISADERESDIHRDNYPLHSIFNRVRITYKYGQASVPDDIVRACILKVAYDLTLSGIARALPEGRDGFQPVAQADLLKEYKSILKEYKTLKVNGF